jgi:hypothetical protein
VIIKKEHWVMPLVFLAVSIPTVLLLQALDLGGDYKLFIAIVAGGICTSTAQGRLRAAERQERKP